MTKENYTEIAAIIDQSGSMSMLVSDTLGGFNTFLKDQQKDPGTVNLTLCLFNNTYKILYSGMNVKEVPDLTELDYKPAGSTALLDAIGRTVNELGDRLSQMAEEDRPSKVIVFIITDGQENSSKEFTKQIIKDMVERQEEVYNWDFIFLGADLSAVAEAQSFGIKDFKAASYSVADTESAYTAVSASVGFAKAGILNKSNELKWKSLTKDERNTPLQPSKDSTTDDVLRGDPGDWNVSKKNTSRFPGDIEHD